MKRMPTMDVEDDAEGGGDDLQASKIDACEAILAAVAAKDAAALSAAMDTMHTLQHKEWGDDSYAAGPGGDAGEA
jgi:hypothetical protein